MVTPVRPDRLAVALEGYDTNLFNYLVQGFERGFHTGFQGDMNMTQTNVSNLSSIEENVELAQSKIDIEVAAGRVAGPFSHIISPFRCSHLSHPTGSSVNDGIPDCYAKVTYSTIDDAIDVINSMGCGCLLAKTDIKSAYKIVPIHPDEQYLLGFTLNSKFYYDRTLPMGLRSSCQIFESISDALKWIATEKFGISPIVKVLDDFMFFAATKETCDRYLRGFSIMCENLGVPLAPEKTEGPNTVLKFWVLNWIRVRWRLDCLLRRYKNVICG